METTGNARYDRYAIEPLDGLGAEAVQDVRRIYEEGFPARLRSDFVTLSSRRRPAEIALALVRDGQPCGFAMLRPLSDTGWVFLRYFVVDGRSRGQGVGGVLWDLVTARLRADGFTLLVFDLEDPAEPDCDEAEVQVRLRRIGFYRRHAARLLPVRGYLTPEKGEWVPLLLMAAPLAGGIPDLRAIVSAVYRYRWEVEPGHPVLADVRIDDAGRGDTDEERT